MISQESHVMQTVFAKTVRGRAALNQRGGELTWRQRSVLIILDGNCSLEMLTGLIPGYELRETVPYLLRQGYIQSLGRHASPAKPLVSAPAKPIKGAEAATPRLTRSEAKVDVVRDFMLTTARTYLGPDAGAIIEAIEGAADAAQLMAVAGNWHMALHASRHGSGFASAYLAKVKAQLIEPQ